MTHRVGPKGQVVVPKAIRDRLGILPGDDVDVDMVGDEIRIRRAGSLSGLLGAAADGAGTEDLDASRARERERERRRA